MNSSQMDANWQAYYKQVEAKAFEEEDMLAAHDLLDVYYDLYVAEGRKLEWENFQGWEYFNRSDIYVLILDGYFRELTSKDPKDYILVNAETSQEYRYDEWFDKVSSLLPQTWHRVFALDDLGAERFDKDGANGLKELFDDKGIKSAVQYEKGKGWFVDVLTNNLIYAMHKFKPQAGAQNGGGN